MAFSYGSIIDKDRTKESPEDAIRFLSLLHAKNQNGFVAIADKGFSGKEWNQKMISLKTLNSSSFYFSKDCYVSVNVFKNQDNRTASNCQNINGIFLDLDIHSNAKQELTKEEVLLESEKVLGVLGDFTEQGSLPKANAVVFTGRGLALYYLYEVPLNTDDTTAVEAHKELYCHAMDYLQVLFAKQNLRIKMDRSVRDASRYCRIPGTKNNAAGEYARLLFVNEASYSLDSLCFEKVDSSVAQYSSTPKKKSSIKRPGEKKQTVKKAGIKKTKTDVSNVKLTGKKTYAPAWAVNLSARRMEQIEMVMKNRGGNDGDFREMAIFIYYNSSKVVHSEELSVEYARHLNDTFTEPLSDEAFAACLNGTNFHKESGVWAEIKRCHSDGVYIFKNETIANLLALSEDECNLIELFKRQNEKKRAVENKKTKAMKKEAAVLMRKNGASYKEISEKIGVCRDTLTRWFRPLGLVGEQKCKEKESDDSVSDFSVNKKEERKKKVIVIENKDQLEEKCSYQEEKSQIGVSVQVKKEKNDQESMDKVSYKRKKSTRKIKESLWKRKEYEEKICSSPIRAGYELLLGLQQVKVYPYSRGASW